MSEPYRLTEWRSTRDPVAGRLFTCARPGRCLCGSKKPVPDDVVDTWVKGLPKADVLTIISLLGEKPPPDEKSEFSFYSFRSGLQTDRPECLTFQTWLDDRHGAGRFCVLEYPTIDTKPVPAALASQAAAEISELLQKGMTVVVIDSGGISRTGELCRFMGFSSR